jgi:amidase
MINRRNFIKKGSAAGIGVAATGLVSCQSPAGEAAQDKKTALSNGGVDDFELDEITIDQLQQKDAKRRIHIEEHYRNVSEAH